MKTKEIKRKAVTLNKVELKKLSANPFKYNRKTTLSHVNSMSSSLSKWGVLRSPIIAYVEEEERSYIADGQHLIQAAINSKEIESLECIEVRVKTKKDLIRLISDLNTSAKAWNNSEFLDAWLLYGQDNLTLEEYFAYYKVKKVSDTTTLSLALIIDIICKDNKKFKTGEAKLADVVLAEIIWKTLDNLKKTHKCPAHQLYGAKAYIEDADKANNLDVDKLRYRIGLLKDYKDAFVPSNREQFKKYLFGLMDCEESDVKKYIEGGWISTNSKG